MVEQQPGRHREGSDYLQAVQLANAEHNQGCVATPASSAKSSIQSAVVSSLFGLVQCIWSLQTVLSCALSLAARAAKMNHPKIIKAARFQLISHLSLSAAADSWAGCLRRYLAAVSAAARQADAMNAPRADFSPAAAAVRPKGGK